jgi:YD repeat-containing protein
VGVLLCAPTHSARAQTPFAHGGLDAQHPGSSVLPNEQVDPASGALTIVSTDLVLPGNAGFNLAVTRVYNSNVYPSYSSGGSTAFDEDSWAGIGWKLHFGRILNPDATGPGETQIEMGDGSRHPLYHRSDGGWITSDFWLYDRVTHTLQLPNGQVYTFDRAVIINDTIGAVRYVTEVRDPFNNRLTFSYFDGSGPPDGVSQIQQHLGSGQVRTVSFGYDPTLRALASMTYNGRTWTYQQQAAGPAGYNLLKHVSPPIGPGWSYDYSQTMTGELEKLTTPSGGWLTYGYQDATRRAGSLSQRARVVTTRTTGGRDVKPGTWTYAYGSGPNQDTTVVTCPCGTTRYRFNGTGVSGDFTGWSAGTLAEQTVEENGITLERHAFYWVRSELISTDPVPGVEGVWADEAVYRPLLNQHVVTRGTHAWTTTNTYHTNLGNVNDYGRPYQVEESYSIYQKRVTTRTFRYGFTPYILNRTATESVWVQTGYDKRTPTESSHWIYDTATGFLTEQSIFGFVTSFEPSPEGNVAVSTDGLGHRTTYAYTWGTVQDVHTPRTQVSYVIDADGLVRSADNHVDSTVNYDYDDVFRPTLASRAGLNPAITKYDNIAGQFLRMERGRAQTESQLDGFGRPVLTFNGFNVKTRVERDACGRTTFTSTPYTVGDGTRGTIVEYDALGRLKSSTDPASAQTTYSYDGADVTKIDAQGHGTRFNYNSMAFGGPEDGRLASVVDAKNVTTSYDYDVFGNLTQVTGPLPGLIRTWKRDNRGQPFEESQPESGTTKYKYDAVGNVSERKDANGDVTTFTYDADNRLWTRDAPGDFDDLSIGYDDAGRVNSLTGGGATTTYNYNKATGHLDYREDTANGFTFRSTYEYDANDNLYKLTYPRGRVVTYEYDDENRLTVVRQNGALFAHSAQYDDGGRLFTYTTGAVTHTITYDDAQRPKRLLSAGAGGALDLTYDYYPGGNVKTITDPRPGASQAFEYDPLDRLFSADGPWGQLRWSYDAAGNRQTETHGGGTTTYTYVAATQRLSATSGAIAENFIYDNVGQLVADGRGTYGYSPLGRLTWATGPSLAANYIYDGAGGRLAKTVNGHTTYTIRSAAGETLSEYESACGSPIWSRDIITAFGRPIGAVRSTATTPSVAMVNAVHTEPEDSTSVSIAVQLTTPGGAPLACPVTVSYTTSAGTATAGTDFTQTAGTLTFPGGTATNATVTITVPLLPDTIYESDETFTVLLTNAAGATIGSPGAETVTIRDDDAAPAMAIDQPIANATVRTPFTVSGWAIDSSVPTGTGVDGIHVYATPVGGSPTFLGVATYGDANSGVAAVYGSRFTNSGYTFTATLSPGTYALTVYARNSATGAFNQSSAIWVTVAPSAPNGSLESPGAGQTLQQPFVLSGWAADQGTGAGTGVDEVRVWAFPNPGSGADPIFMGFATYGGARTDIGGLLGAGFTNSGFQLVIRGLAPGVYQFKALARSTVTGQVYWLPNPANGTTVTVQANPHMWVDGPAPNATVSQTFIVSGWAVDLAASAGTGVSTLHVWAYPSAGGSPTFLGAATSFGARSDIGAWLGPQFTNSGFSLTTPTLAPGTYQIVVYAWSTVENNWNQAQSLSVTVATSQPIVAVDGPAPSAIVSQPFIVGGWAIDPGAPIGTGIDAVHVYAVANSGAGDRTLIGAAANTGSRPDVGGYYGGQFTNSGYTYSASGFAPGVYRIEVYAHSTVSGNWTVVSRLVTVQ